MPFFIYFRCAEVHTLESPQPQPPVYGHYTDQPVLAGTWKILLVQSFTARVPLLTVTSALGLGRRHWSSQQCYLHCLRTTSVHLK